MTAVVLAAAILFGYGANPSNIYAGYAERPHAGYAQTIAGFEIAEEPIYGTVKVAGEVVRPGVYDYYPGMTVSSAIGDAGNLLSRAEYDELRLVRQTSAGKRWFRLSYHINNHRLVLLYPGDVLVVPDRLR